MSNVIVIGCGRVGSQLATLLSEHGANVTVVDVNAEAFSELGKSFNGSTVQGLGYDEDVLQEAGIQTCDVLAAVTQNDNANLMTAEVARRIFGVDHTIVRLYNANRERAYMQLGIDFVCGTSLVAEELFSKIVSGHGNHLDTFGEFEILRFSLSLTSTKAKSIKVSDLEKTHGVRIVVFERADGSTTSIPSKDSVLYHGDTVVACIHHDLLKAFSRFMQE